MTVSRCNVCFHPEVDTINGQLAQGYPVRVIAATYGIAGSVLYRHKAEHLLTYETDQGMAFVTMQNVLDIPLQMRKRGQLAQGLMERALEPLEKPGPAAFNKAQLGFIIRLMRIQQIDEQTVLKVMGVLKSSNDESDLSNAQFLELRGVLEGRIKAITDGSEENVVEAKLALAEMLYPMKELEADGF